MSVPQRPQSNGGVNQHSLRTDSYNFQLAETRNPPFPSYDGQAGRSSGGEVVFASVPGPNRLQSNGGMSQYTPRTGSYNFQLGGTRDPPLPDYVGQTGRSHEGEVGVGFELGVQDSLGEPARVRESLTRATRSPPLRFDFTPSASSLPSEMSMAPATPRDNRNERAQNGGGAGGAGPHPSFIQVANPYIFEQKIQDCLTALGSSEAKEDNIRLQGVLWIDSVRKALQL